MAFRGFEGVDVHPEREFVVAANVGRRAWILDDFDKPLRSLSWDYRWDTRGPHRSRRASDYVDPSNWAELYPTLGNAAGFYGYYGIRGTFDHYSELAEPSYEIFGMVEGYGRTVVGTAGFRSEVAIILAFTTQGIKRHPGSQRNKAGYWVRPPGEDMRDEKTRARIRDYLDTKYPEVPIFGTTMDMLKMFPLTGKPHFA